MREVADINQLIEAVRRREDPAASDIEVLVAWVIARKAMIFATENSWMSAWHRTVAI